MLVARNAYYSIENHDIDGVRALSLSRVVSESSEGLLSSGAPDGHFVDLAVMHEYTLQEFTQLREFSSSVAPIDIRRSVLNSMCISSLPGAAAGAALSLVTPLPLLAAMVTCGAITGVYAGLRTYLRIDSVFNTDKVLHRLGDIAEGALRPDADYSLLRARLQDVMRAHHGDMSLPVVAMLVLRLHIVLADAAEQQANGAANLDNIQNNVAAAA